MKKTNGEREGPAGPKPVEAISSKSSENEYPVRYPGDLTSSKFDAKRILGCGRDL